MEQRRSNKVWVCWLQGFDGAPDVVRACLNSIRRNIQGYEIIALDENNLRDYVQLPGYIEEKYRQGIISRPHYSDLIRTALLCEHGGLWIDATVLCTSPSLMPVIERAPLFVYRDYRISRRDAPPTIASSWLIGAVSNHPILRLTQKLLYEYWKRETWLRDYFLFHLFFAMAARQYPEEWEAAPPYNNISPYTLQFEGRKPYTRERWEELRGFSPFHKLSYHSNTSQDEASMYVRVIREYLSD